MKYVVKNPSGAYMYLHSDKSYLYPVLTSLDNAKKYTKKEIKKMQKRLKKEFEEYDYTIYKVVLTEVKL